jgi:parallel beta-helix repeat protein
MAAFNTQLVFTQSVTITVPDDYSTIQEAVYAADVGDTIFVRSGTYHEHVTVNKVVSLIGENRGTTIIRGDRVNNVIDVTGENVTISGFTITDSGPEQAGINVTESSGCIITGNEIFSNYFGVSISGRVGTIYWNGEFKEVWYPADWNILENNIIHSNGYIAIYFSPCARQQRLSQLTVPLQKATRCYFLMLQTAETTTAQSLTILGILETEKQEPE